ncbi:uncharacterized protein EV420DRAFT_1275981 [Desarmillaria tabescens]|uniref:Uncharacterized protein n=1 Tax=Armillaria tabescens TaxID=1929756 RepID=A0AA39JS43_ARMTA|nr:uncharacterized protein EV420DRAFT_1275981 [Desarmillaria tabescens]KAK0447906.1 hypothetical protein EV420DRAFT_1275981 [Desarmillaria tabescens]
MDISLISVNLATAAVEGVLYGVFLILDVTSIALLFARETYISRATRPSSFQAIRRPMFIGAVILLVSVTGHWICTVIRLFDAFVKFEGGTQPLKYSANLSQITEVVKTGFLIGSVVTSDAMIIYRLWVVWGYNYRVIIFPLGTLVGLTVCGAGITYQFAKYTPGQDVFATAAGRWITSDCVFTLLTNVYSTTMIAWYIYRTHRAASSADGAGQSLMVSVPTDKPLRTWTTLFMIIYLTKTNIQFNIVDFWPEAAGIAFSLINVRVGLGWAQKAGTSTLGGSLSSRSGSAPGTEFPLCPLTINISQAMVKDSGECQTNDKNPIPKSRGYENLEA